MTEYIPKSVVLAEIERLITPECCYSMNKLIEFLDTLEVKEVDLEKVFNEEYSKFSNDTDAMDYAFPIDLADYKDFARHFFELGIKARKGINQ